MSANYNIAAIRNLLLAAFTVQDLRRICTDYPALQPIRARFSPNDGLDDLVAKVMDYCASHALWDQLLAAAQRENPAQYARFAYRFNGVAPPISDTIAHTRLTEWIAWGLLLLAGLVCIYLVSFRPKPQLNRLITYDDFEGADDGWSRIKVQERSAENTTISEFPGDSFPGSMTRSLTGECSLIGEQSLKIVTNVNIAGKFKAFVYRQGAFTGNGATIYVYTPNPDTASAISYLQLCVPSHDWVCSDGTKLVAGEWTPITLDLSLPDKEGKALSAQKLTELAVQWVFETQSPLELELYFDAGEIFHAGP